MTKVRNVEAKEQLNFEIYSATYLQFMFFTVDNDRRNLLIKEDKNGA